VTQKGTTTLADVGGERKCLESVTKHNRDRRKEEEGTEIHHSPHVRVQGIGDGVGDEPGVLCLCFC